MHWKPSALEQIEATYRLHLEQIDIRTCKPLQFIDVTDQVAEIVRQSGVVDGTVAIQTQHTTTAVTLNENEPLLLRDLEDMLKRTAPAHGAYRHDDLSVRTVNLQRDERANGHAHARAVLLGASETIVVAGAAMHLGRWQRIFLVELDGPRNRAVSVSVMGVAVTTRFPSALGVAQDATDRLVS